MSERKIQPIGQRVLIKALKQEEKTKGGIYIPDSAKEERKEGEVIALGTYDDGQPLPLSIGDHILYSGYSADEFEIEGQKVKIIEFKDVVATIQKE